GTACVQHHLIGHLAYKLLGHGRRAHKWPSLRRHPCRWLLLPDSQQEQSFGEKRTLRYRERSRSEERTSRLDIQKTPRGQASKEECVWCIAEIVLVGDKAQDPDNGAPILTKCDPRVANIATKEAKENRIGVNPETRWRIPCMRVAVCLSIDQGELLRGHSYVEAGGRKERGSDDESSGAQLPKSKASVRKEVDSEEHHSTAEVDLSITKEGTQM
ncbi:hypothetical protein B296_00030837, partial [Ensete ventricosum]